MKEAVLDASAVLAMIKREPGGEQVKEFLGRAVMSAVNLSEVLKRLGVGSSDARDVIEDLDQSGICIESFDETQAALAAEIADQTAPLGLSYSDRSCLALALSMDRNTVVTADREWRKLKLPFEVVIVR